MKNVDIKYQLGIIEGKLDALLKQMEGQHERMDNHSKRITALEVFRWKAAGALLALNAVMGLALAWYSKHG